MAAAAAAAAKVAIGTEGLREGFARGRKGGLVIVDMERQARLRQGIEGAGQTYRRESPLHKSSVGIM